MQNVRTRTIEINVLLFSVLDKNCFIPRCTKNTMDMVKITSVSDFESLPLNRWNIPEPPLDQERENGKVITQLYTVWERC